MSDVLDNIDPETPLGWLRDYIRSNDRAPLTRLRALDRLRMVVASREERPLYFEGYDADLMGPRHSQPTARQWLHRYVMGDVVGPKSFNDLAHAKVEEAVAEAYRQGVASVRSDEADVLRARIESLGVKL